MNQEVLKMHRIVGWTNFNHILKSNKSKKPKKCVGPSLVSKWENGACIAIKPRQVPKLPQEITTMLFFHQERNHEFLSGKDNETHSPYLSALNICNSPVWNIEFDELEISLFQTWILQATTGRKIQFKLGKNPVHQTRYFTLENCKNQVQIDRRNDLRLVRSSAIPIAFPL